MSAAPAAPALWIATPQNAAPLAFDTLRDMAVHILDLARPKDIAAFDAQIYLPGDNIAAHGPRPCVLIRATGRFGGETVCYAGLDLAGDGSRREVLFNAIVAAARSAQDPDRYRPEGVPPTPEIPGWATAMIAGAAA